MSHLPDPSPLEMDLFGLSPAQQPPIFQYGKQQSSQQKRLFVVPESELTAATQTSSAAAAPKKKVSENFEEISAADNDKFDSLFDTLLDQEEIQEEYELIRGVGKESSVAATIRQLHAKLFSKESTPLRTPADDAAATKNFKKQFATDSQRDPESARLEQLRRADFEIDELLPGSTALTSAATFTSANTTPNGQKNTVNGQQAKKSTAIPLELLSRKLPLVPGGPVAPQQPLRTVPLVQIPQSTDIDGQIGAELIKGPWIGNAAPTAAAAAVAAAAAKGKDMVYFDIYQKSKPSRLQQFVAILLTLVSLLLGLLVRLRVVSQARKQKFEAWRNPPQVRMEKYDPTKLFSQTKKLAVDVATATQPKPLPLQQQSTEELKVLLATCVQQQDYAEAATIAALLEQRKCQQNS